MRPAKAITLPDILNMGNMTLPLKKSFPWLLVRPNFCKYSNEYPIFTASVVSALPDSGANPSLNSLIISSLNSLCLK